MGEHKVVLRSLEDGTLEFGNYALTHKAKQDNFEFEGDIYKVRTCSEVTKLDKNEMFVYESVPGSTVKNYHATATEVNFEVASFEDVQITLELEPKQEYETFVNQHSVGVQKTNISGKLSLSIELEANNYASVLVVKR